MLNLQYNDVLNNLMEVAAQHPEMTEEMMFKTVVQFFTDGYETASQVFDTASSSADDTVYSVGVRRPPLLADDEPRGSEEAAG